MMCFAMDSRIEDYGDLSVTELSSMLVTKNVFSKDQVGYTTLFEKDFMAFPHRINRNIDEHSFQVATGTGTSTQTTWHAHEEKSIEQVSYHSPKDAKDPSKVITKIEFEGWRRYVEERRPTEGGRIIFHVKGLQKQALLARIIDDKSFREIGWMEPIVAVTDAPILAVNFRETAIENNPDYIDNLFSRIRHVEAIPKEIVLDLKNVIALNAIDRFKQRMIQSGFSEYEYEEYLKLIRPTALKDIASPFYVAAQFCRDNVKFEKARKLLRKIPKTHWQFEDARELESSLYEQEMRENKNKYEQVIHELKSEVLHLRARGSIADKNSSVEVILERREALQKETVKDEIKQEILIDNQKINPATLALAERLSETPFGKEIIPYFQGLQSVLAMRQEKPENKPIPQEKPKATRHRAN